MSDASQPSEQLSTAPPARVCGDCGLCCKIMGVEAIGKPPRKWCRHFRRGHGCDVYTERPAACAAFNCIWLLAENLGDAWRPDRAGFVMHSENDGRRLVIEVDPSRPHDWRREPYHATLLAWARGVEVLVLVAARGVRLAPNGAETPIRRA